MRPGNGLLLFFRVDDFDTTLANARALVSRLDEEPHLNGNTGTIGESIELQRLAVARQAQVRNIAIPLIIVVLFLIGYLMVKYRMF